MWRRVRQFATAIAAAMRDDDRRFAAAHLPPELLALFEAMPVAEQVHAVNVARTALARADRAPAGLDRLTLARCALLHDVGKGDVSTAGKVLAVLAEALRLRDPRCHALRGAAMLRECGCPDLAAIVARHHDPNAPGLLLALLRQADEEN